MRVLTSFIQAVELTWIELCLGYLAWTWVNIAWSWASR